MATIKQRKSSYAVIYWYSDAQGHRKQKWDTEPDRPSANKRKAFVEYYQSAHGKVLVPDEASLATLDIQSTGSLSEATVADLMKEFVDIYGTACWAPSTYANKLGVINNYILPYLGALPVKALTTQRLDAYYNRLLSVPEVPKCNQQPSGRCVQPANIKKIHDIIRCALNQAIKWGYLRNDRTNPASLATLPKGRKNRRAVWDVETFKKAVSASTDDLLTLCMHLAFSCSLRIGEICGLTWADVIIDDDSIDTGNARLIINKELARISISAATELREKDIIKKFPPLHAPCTTELVLKTPKTESSNRTVWVPRTVAKMLVDHKEKQVAMKKFLGDVYNDYNLVVALDNGNPVESRVIRLRLNDLCEKNSLPPVVFHSLRHLSTGYKLKMTGGDVKSVQGDTGHSEAEMVTDVYSEIVDEDRRKNAQKMEASFYETASQPNELTAIENMIGTLTPEQKTKLVSLLLGNH